jgi:hypothetical protein
VLHLESEILRNQRKSVLLQLASNAGRYITGQTILVDGGISVGAVRALSNGESRA